MNPKPECRRYSRVKVNRFDCYFKIPLNNGFIGLGGGIVDASKHGVRIRIAYKPTVSDMIQIEPNYTFDNPIEGATLIVRWCNPVQIDNDQLFEVGCEALNQANDVRDNLRRKLGWN